MLISGKPEEAVDLSIPSDFGVSAKTLGLGSRRSLRTLGCDVRRLEPW
jgi:hypothetical protein